MSNATDEEKVAVDEAGIVGVLVIARHVFLDQPMKIEVEAGDVRVAGDIHGQFFDLMRLFRMAGMPGEKSWVGWPVQTFCIRNFFSYSLWVSKRG